MTSRITRREIVQRGAAGVTILSLPGLLAACGGGGGGSGERRRVGGRARFSNWPLYIDVDEKTKKHPTLDAVHGEDRIKVEYFEDINDNASTSARSRAAARRAAGSTATSSCSPTTRATRRC